MKTLSLELAKTADKIVKEEGLLGLKEGDHLLICADTSSDESVVDAVAKAAYVFDVQVAVLWFPSDVFEKGAVPRAVSAALTNTGAILELTKGTFARSLGEQIRKAGARYLSLGGHHNFAEAETLVRVIGRVNYDALLKLEEKLVELMAKARRIRMTTREGTDIRYDLDPGRPVIRTSMLSPRLLAGLVAWAPLEESVDGILRVDGCVIDPPIEHRQLSVPLEIQVQKGTITAIKGSGESEILKRWFENKDEKTKRLAHFTFGLNPGTTLVGRVIEGEHHFGTTTPAFGWQNPALKGKLEPTAGHCDCVILNVTTFLDDVPIQKEGKFIHPELVPMAEALFG